jgi:hypothetical protein
VVATSMSAVVLFERARGGGWGEDLAT